MFDMDGTLLDSWDALLGAYHDATTEVLGAPFPVERADIDQLIQLSARDAFPRLAGGDLGAGEADPGRVRGELPVAQRRRSASTTAWGRCCARCASRASSSGIATSKSRVRLDRDLEQTGIAELLDATICGDEVPIAKPDPAPIHAIMELLGVAPAGCAVRGRRRQRRHGRAAGRACEAVGAGYGFHPHACRAAGPEHWIDEPLALPGVVAGARTAG